MIIRRLTKSFFLSLITLQSVYSELSTLSRFPKFPEELKQRTIKSLLSKDTNIKLTDVSSNLFNEQQQRSINYFNGLERFNAFYNETPKNTYYRGSASEIKRHFKSMSYDMVLKMIYSKDLERMIDHLLLEKKDFLEKSFAVKDYYFPLIEAFLDRFELPLELKYLAVVESGLNPLAHSSAGAKGIWQFIYSTGRSLGLKINSFIDERANPVESTIAACTYLKKLYNIFEDWNLAMAAYNCGMGNLKKAINRAGGSRNFWAIKPYLPRETQNYVISFYAIAYLFKYGHEYNLSEGNLLKSFFDTDTVHVKGPIYLKDISKLLNIDISELNFLNPSYILGVIPKSNQKRYSIRLPISKMGVFVSNQMFIEYYGHESFNRSSNKKIKTLLTKKKTVKRRIYIVKRGDVLSRIARRLATNVRKLKQRNNLRSDKIKPGMILRY